MKIALIVEHADASRGGAERYTMQLAAALTERGHRVTVLAREGTSAPAGVELVLLPARAMGKTARYARFLQMLDEHVRDHPYDIVHAMMPVYRCDIYHPHAGLAAEAMERGYLKHGGKMRQSVSRWTNQMHLRRRYFRGVERKLLGGKDEPIVLCVSELVKREVRQHYPLPDDRLAVLFNAVDLEKFDPKREPAARTKVRRRHGLEDDQIVGLLVAQNFRLKGLSVAIEAMAELNDPHMVLLVVGKESPAPYARQARRLGIERQVIFAGTTDNIYSYYAAADVLVLATMRDSCSLVVLEALAMGLPVISTASNGACEIMENGRQGLILSDAQDVHAVAEAWKKIGNAPFRRLCSQECLDLRARLSFDMHLSRLVQIYEKRAKISNR